MDPRFVMDTTDAKLRRMNATGDATIIFSNQGITSQ